MLGNSAFLAPEASSHSTSPSPLSLSLSCNLSASLSVLSYLRPVILRVWTSGSYSITPLSLWDLPPLAGTGSPWRVTNRGRGAHLIPADPGPASSPRPEIYEADTGSNLMLCSGWKSDCPHILTFIFLPPREAELGTGWDLLHTGVRVDERPACGLQSHAGQTTVWFLGLIILVGSGQGAASFSGPFWKCAGWFWMDICGLSLQWLSVSLPLSHFRRFLSRLPLALPWSLPLYSSSPLSWGTGCVFKLCHWCLGLWCGFVCPAAPVSLCWHCGHGRFSLKFNSPHCPRLQR